MVSTSPRLLEEARERPHRLGGDWFVRKPLDLDDLLHAIGELIGRA